MLIQCLYNAILPQPRVFEQQEFHCRHNIRLLTYYWLFKLLQNDYKYLTIVINLKIM